MERVKGIEPSLSAWEADGVRPAICGLRWSSECLLEGGMGPCPIERPTGGRLAACGSMAEKYVLGAKTLATSDEMT
jgi:hypothetical protein